MLLLCCHQEKLAHLTTLVGRHTLTKQANPDFVHWNMSLQCQSKLVPHDRSLQACDVIHRLAAKALCQPSISFTTQLFDLDESFHVLTFKAARINIFIFMNRVDT